ncbi:MAG: Smr/MutS family protein [Oscillospiraceae bacterium]|nr:Smr/MutS family protein [Oscillospiraceae bacterium]
MKTGGTLREINIKSDMPTVDDAIRRVTYHVKNAGVLGISAIKIIHGYGSTGKGGAIRTETRKYLDRIKKGGQIKGFINGEDFSLFDKATREAFLVCDALRRDSDIERHNNGITIVIV